MEEPMYYIPCRECGKDRYMIDDEFLAFILEIEPEFKEYWQSKIGYWAYKKYEFPDSTQWVADSTKDSACSWHNRRIY